MNKNHQSLRLWCSTGSIDLLHIINGINDAVNKTKF
jgi:hypothetical protein